jgi:hypothetical protein
MPTCSTPRAEAFRETKSDQLSVSLRFPLRLRYPRSISVIGGTGLTAHTF